MVETRLAHRDGSGELFIGTSKLSFALMNSAPAELLHPLSNAALQPLLMWLGDNNTEEPPSKKRRQSCRRWNSVSQKPSRFSKKTPPCLIGSSAAALSDKIGSVFCYSLISSIASPALQSLIFILAVFCLTPLLAFFASSSIIFSHSQLSAPPVWYSITRVSKKLRSFFKSIISLIHGKGFSSCANIGSRPICCARRFAMKRK